eukprot:6192403-Pleurochrysis_carterae.AAC.5
MLPLSETALRRQTATLELDETRRAPHSARARPPLGLDSAAAEPFSAVRLLLPCSPPATERSPASLIP